MEYGVYGIQALFDSINKQYDDLRDPFLKCRTKSDLKAAIAPHVFRINSNYKDCYLSQHTYDSYINEMYSFIDSVYAITGFSKKTLKRIVEDIIDEHNAKLLCIKL